MWGSFVLAAMFALILLYLPGYLLGRVYFSSSANSLAFAPCIYACLIGFAGCNSFPVECLLVCSSRSCVIGKHHHLFDLP